MRLIKDFFQVGEIIFPMRKVHRIRELPPAFSEGFCPHRQFCLANTVGRIQPTHRQFWAGPRQPPSLKGTLEARQYPHQYCVLCTLPTPSQTPRHTDMVANYYLSMRETCVKVTARHSSPLLYENDCVWMKDNVSLKRNGRRFLSSLSEGIFSPILAKFRFKIF